MPSGGGVAGGGVRTVPPTSESAGENVPAVSRPGATHTLTEWLWFRPQPSLLLTLRSRGKVISSYIGAVSPGQEEAGGANSTGWGGAGGACTPCQTGLRSGCALEQLAGYAPPRQPGVGRVAHAPPGTPPLNQSGEEACPALRARLGAARVVGFSGARHASPRRLKTHSLHRRVGSSGQHFCAHQVVNS